MKFKKLSFKIPASVFETVYSLPLWQKAAIFAGAWLVPLVAFWFLFASSRLAEMDSLSSQLPGLRHQIHQLQLRSKQIPQLEEELKTIENILTKAMKLLPETKDIPSVLTNISSLGNEAHLQFEMFQPTGEIPVDFYAKIPVNLTFSGPFHNIVGFFDKVSRMPRIVHIKEVDMGRAERSKEVWSQTGQRGAKPGLKEQSNQGEGTQQVTPGPEGGGTGDLSIQAGGTWIVKTTCKAVTYRFLSAEEQKKARSNKGKKKKKR